MLLKQRRLPCSNCNGAWLKEGPYFLTRWPGRDPYQYRCFKCKKQTTLLQREWATIPTEDLVVEEATQ